MEQTSSAYVDDAGGEVGRLQGELRKAEERMRLWKEKTQIAVNELRERIVRLTRERDELQEASRQWRHQQELQQQQQQQQHVHNGAEGGVAGVLPPLLASSSVCIPADSILGDLMRWTGATMDVFLVALLKKSEVALEVAASASQELDKCQRRTAQTLRLQAKNIETLQSEASVLQQQLNEALAAVRERNHAVDSRDQALSVLQNRLEDLEAANVRLESSQLALNSKPNVEQINLLEARLEEEMEKLRREFASRESVIFDQHRDEIERLVASHEEEVAELRAELEERALAAETAVAAQTAAAKVDAEFAEKSGERAYMDLLREFEALQDELKLAEGEKETLLVELREVQSKLARGGGGTSTDKTLLDAQHGSLTLPQAMARIAELEGGMLRLSEELCETKKRLVAAKHQTNSKEASRSQVLEGQQLSYLRCTVVKLLCAKEGGSVGRSLFPVLSTLLQFTEADLQQIYSAHSDWVKRRF
ncbi:uncharacterized protein Tco025E_01147 [Trypanosoma conorhini]|uniref:GRIP domain-containing protein n=1 Tax=Trypanosoma conorhini TaxID=83891 RepID=A0A422Q9C0_9TRYP|nr:uncharacterized protein Tco025E_01147 [Trypanosoma conorhini]RNF26544.1 hypothetical protein Tco025E_01147 [Trypanosoma conorhini]